MILVHCQVQTVKVRFTHLKDKSTFCPSCCLLLASFLVKAAGCPHQSCSCRAKHRRIVGCCRLLRPRLNQCVRSVPVHVRSEPWVLRMGLLRAVLRREESWHSLLLPFCFCCCQAGLSVLAQAPGLPVSTLPYSVFPQELLRPHKFLAICLPTHYGLFLLQKA